MTDHKKCELLPCPFCGDLPEKATMETPRGIIYFLECTNDECPAHSVSVCGDHFEQSAINKWNTRPTRPSLEHIGEIIKNPYKKALNINQHQALNKIETLRSLILEGRPITQAHQDDLLSLINNKPMY